MQTIFSFILGVALTIGVAYIHDASISAPSANSTAAPTAEQRQMVNWDVLDSSWRGLKTNISHGWRKLQSSIG